MKKFFTLIVACVLFTGIVSAQALFISEVADPKDNANARFVELYNASDVTVDFGTTVMYLSRQSNGGTTWGDVQLTGTVAAGATYVIGASGFEAAFGKAPELESGVLNANGDDAYYLYTGGNHVDGTLYDIYGALDTDGTDEAWEFLDGGAVRKGGVENPNTTWTASEWEVTMPLNVADFTPGSHSTEVVVDTDAPVWEATYPMAVNIEDVQFDLMAQLDETSTVYYVVLADGATAPTVEEVKAGTGSAAAAAVVAGSFTAGTSETAETVTGLVVETAYDVYVVAEDDEATPNVQAAVVLVELTTVVMPDVLLKADFETDLTPFTAVSVTGDQVWAKSSYGGFAAISGYVSGDKVSYVNEDWLISVGIDLAAATGEVLSFESANNFGDQNSTLKVKISSDFNGTYDAASIAAATWTDITDQFTLSSGGSWDFYASGDLDFTPYAESGTGYLAFVYECIADNAGTWEIDNVLYTGFLVPGSDASLSDLLVDDATITDFDAATLTYTVDLPAGTATVPTITATTTDDQATVVVTEATDLAGDAAARTTTVVVTAQDGTTTQTYSVLFNPVVEVADLGALRVAADETRKYVVTGEVVLTYQQSYRNKKYVQDANGAVEIDDDGGVITTTYNLYDGITGLEGTVEVYRGVLQFHPTADPGAATSTGHDVAPLEATPSAINADIDAYESRLVIVKNVTLKEADGTVAFENGNEYTIEGDEEMMLRVNFYSTSLTGTVLPDSANITGIINEYNGTAQMSPRSADDLEELIKHIPSSDATLASLEVDGTAVTGFSPASLAYYVTLAAGTTTTPAVTATVAHDSAEVVITDATDVTSTDAAARTTTIEVTAEDGTVKTYTIEFTVEVSVASEKFANVNVYPIPASDNLYITNAGNARTIKVLSMTGATVMSVNNEGEPTVSLDVASLKAGVYMIKLEGENTTGVVRFIKK